MPFTLSNHHSPPSASPESPSVTSLRYQDQGVESFFDSNYGFVSSCQQDKKSQSHKVEEPARSLPVHPGLLQQYKFTTPQSFDVSVKPEMQVNNTILTKQGKNKRSKSGTGECVISELIDRSCMSPPIQHEEKRKRRKRARTEEEKKQRALERKMKNRQSAMRSRQRVLNELKKDKEEIERLRLENEDLKVRLAKLENEMKQARVKLTGEKPFSKEVASNQELSEAKERTPSPLAECQMKPSSGTINPFAGFEDPSALDFLDILASEGLHKLEKLNSIDISAYKNLPEINFDPTTIFDNGTPQVNYLSTTEEGSSSCNVSSCDSESLYNETARFGGMKKEPGVPFSRSYNFSWLSEILRFKIQQQKTQRSHSINSSHEPSLDTNRLSKLCKLLVKHSGLAKVNSVSCQT